MVEMTSLILGLAIGLPVLAILLLKTDAAIMFLSLCAGTVVLKYMGTDAILAADTMVPTVDPATAVQIILLTAPAVVAAFALKGTINSSKTVINLLPAIGFGLSIVLLLAPELPPTARTALSNSPFWPQLASSQDLVFGAACLTSLISLWLLHHKRIGHSKSHKKSH